ncbi:MAG: hypothetical protein HOM69_07880 [Gammaproteobacteria bacterium]|nr:hypothetical protein [Gammaproteobacteria bacterium]MBT5053125.1 hypothetical protein [Gammaproteobacteria bacterium]
MIRLALLSSVLVSGNLGAETLCSLGDLQRVISVEYESNVLEVPCQVRYKKVNEGEITYPWRAKRQAGYCEARAKALAAKFTALGWTCETKPESNPDRSEEHSASNP